MVANRVGKEGNGWVSGSGRVSSSASWWRSWVPVCQNQRPAADPAFAAAAWGKQALHSSTMTTTMGTRILCATGRGGGRGRWLGKRRGLLLF